MSSFVMDNFIINEIIVVWFGITIGSFLNVLILRIPKKEDFVFKHSYCPKCKTPLKWWHNIPVISYLLLRGKCGFCGEKISMQYPLVEVISGVVFGFVYYFQGITWSSLFLVGGFLTLLVINVINFNKLKR